MQGRPRFFCDHCGAEVPFQEKRCPRCGRYFSSIRCPRCGFTGEDALFGGGCPACGYSAAGGKKRSRAREGGRTFGSLPLWVYLLTAGLIGLLAVYLSDLR